MIPGPIWLKEDRLQAVLRPPHMCHVTCITTHMCNVTCTTTHTNKGIKMFSNVRWITSEESHLRFHMNVHTYAEVHTSYVEVHTYAEMHMFTHTHLHLKIHKINIIKPVNPSMNN